MWLARVVSIFTISIYNKSIGRIQHSTLKSITMKYLYGHRKRNPLCCHLNIYHAYITQTNRITEVASSCTQYRYYNAVQFKASVWNITDYYTHVARSCHTCPEHRQSGRHWSDLSADQEWSPAECSPLKWHKSHHHHHHHHHHYQHQHRIEWPRCWSTKAHYDERSSVGTKLKLHIHKASKPWRHASAIVHLENPFTNVHSNNEYLCQIPVITTQISSHKQMFTDRLTMDGWLAIWHTVEPLILATLNFGIWVNVIILDPVILAFLLPIALKRYCIQIFAACYFRELARLAKFAK